LPGVVLGWKKGWEGVKVLGEEGFGLRKKYEGGRDRFCGRGDDWCVEGDAVERAGGRVFVERLNGVGWGDFF